MLIVGDNLKYLITQYDMVDKDGQSDNTCISLSLGSDFIELNPIEPKDTIIYGENIPEGFIRKGKITEDGLLLPPKGTVLISSYERISMPLGYFGILQTKGSLARLFVTINMADGQIDPGFSGNITFEVFNASNFNIKFHKRQKVGNLYIFKTSSKNMKPYSGRYNNSAGPTCFIPED